MKESGKIADKPSSRGRGPQPLVGKTILITRPVAQSKEMTSLFKKFGASVIHCPTIEVVEPESWYALDAAINQLVGYDWIVFTSANGAVFFFRRLAEKLSDVVGPMSDLVVC